MRNFAFQGAQPSLGNDLVSTTRYLTFAENGAFTRAGVEAPASVDLTLMLGQSAQGLPPGSAAKPLASGIRCKEDTSSPSYSSRAFFRRRSRFGHGRACASSQSRFRTLDSLSDSRTSLDGSVRHPSSQ